MFRDVDCVADEILRAKDVVSSHLVDLQKSSVDSGAVHMGGFLVEAVVLKDLIKSDFHDRLLFWLLFSSLKR